MTHLPLTGYYAGVPLCQCDKEDAASKGDTFLHAIYAPIEKMRIEGTVCPACLAEWDAAERED